MEKTKKELLEIIGQMEHETEELNKKIFELEEKHRKESNEDLRRLGEGYEKIKRLEAKIAMLKVDKIADAKLTAMLLKASASGFTHRQKEHNTNLMTSIINDRINELTNKVANWTNSMTAEDDLPF